MSRWRVEMETECDGEELNNQTKRGSTHSFSISICWTSVATYTQPVFLFSTITCAPEERRKKRKKKKKERMEYAHVNAKAGIRKMRSTKH